CADWSFFFFSSRRRHTRLVSDWSSDVCSSDLARPGHRGRLMCPAQRDLRDDTSRALLELTRELADKELRPIADAAERESRFPREIGRASCRERGEVSGVGVLLKT